MPNILLPDLPPALEQFVREHYTEEVSALRALQAPWPGLLCFHSAYEDRDLWRGGRLDSQEQKRRQTYEQLLTLNRDSFNRDKPFFPAVGTGGTLRSPYTELPDADYWLYVMLWRGEEDARRELTKPMPALGGVSTLQYLDRARHFGLGEQILARLRHRPDPRGQAYSAHIADIGGSFQ